MCEIMDFTRREDFRQWLYDNCMSSAGIWLLLGKAGGPKSKRSS